MCTRAVDYTLLFDKFRSIILSKQAWKNDCDDNQYNKLPKLIKGLLVLCKVLKARSFNKIYKQQESKDGSLINELLNESTSRIQIQDIIINVDNQHRDQIEEIKEINLSHRQNSKKTCNSICDEFENNKSDVKTAVSNNLFNRFATFFSKLSS